MAALNLVPLFGVSRYRCDNEVDMPVIDTVLYSLSLLIINTQRVIVVITTDNRYISNLEAVCLKEEFGR